MSKTYNLEDRTLEFATAIILFCQSLPQNLINAKLIGQLVSASGSVGANYREANEALSKKDFVYRIKIARKECKESTYWLSLVKTANPKLEAQIVPHMAESKELRSIFTAIINKFK